MITTGKKPMNQRIAPVSCIVFWCRAKVENAATAHKAGWQQCACDNYTDDRPNWKCPEHKDKHYEAMEDL